jgi:DNA-binding NarL/FixJ family response regulator
MWGQLQVHDEADGSDVNIDLTRRELDVLRLIAVGHSNRDIATKLSISSSTVAHHVTNILDKTGTENRTQAAALAARIGIVAR